MSRAQFIARLKPFLRKLPTGHKFTIEIRNKHWLTAGFFKLLREHNVAYALTDQSWIPGPNEIFAKVDPITADFTYIRWLGDRKGIEQVTKRRGPHGGNDLMGGCPQEHSASRSHDLRVL